MSIHPYRNAIFFILLSLPLSACNSTPSAQTAQGAGGGSGGRGGRAGGGGGAVPVVTTKAEARSVPITIPAVGTAEAINSVQIRSQVTGQLSVIQFTEGQEVKKGQPLFSLDPRPFQAALQQAQAVLARDTATSDNAQAQRTRYEDLYKRGLIPRDQYETQAASAQSAQATIEADRAAVETAKLNLQYASITAPIGGRTGALSVHQGDLIRANDTNPMVVINQLAPIYATFAVPGRYLADVRRYQAQHPLQVIAQGQASVPPGAQPPAPRNPGGMVADTGNDPSRTPGGGIPGAAGTDPRTDAGVTAASPGPTATGSVTFIDNTVDASTGTIKLKATFPNTDHALWPGLFVQVTLALSSDPHAIVVPAVAVQSSQSGSFVYVVKPDRTVEMRPVDVQRQQGDVMVIARGLMAGETVVTDGQLRLTPGVRVTEAGRGGQGGRQGGQGAGQGGNGQGGGENPGGGSGRGGRTSS